jgi:hypothetical protein
MTEAAVERRRFRVTAFHVGLIAGAATAVAIPFLVFAAIDWLDPPQPYSLEVLANGADMSRAGGQRTLIEPDWDDRPTITATCNGVCDDLGYRVITGDSAYTVRVLDAKGACVACGEAGYVNTRTAMRLRIGGAGKLVVTSELLGRGQEASQARGAAGAAAPKAAASNP